MTSLDDAQLAHLLGAVALLLAFAHLGGAAFARIGHPRVIGEVVGGVLLGPTVAGRLLPDPAAGVIPTEGPPAAALAALYQLGLLLLMFIAGVELRAVFRRTERVTAAALAGFGTVLPFAAAVVAFPLFERAELAGPAASDTSLLLVFAAAVAVTSIPVISRIMLDLGLLDSSFGRIVLGAAILEDVVLYAALAMAVGLSGSGPPTIGLAELLRVDPGSAAGAAYYAGGTSLVLSAALLASGLGHAGSGTVRRAYDAARGSVAWQVCLLLITATGCVLINVTPVFGALVAGIVMAGRGEPANDATRAIKRVSLGVFVPLYFALVGFRLDLVSDLNLLFFLAFFAFACAVKGGSVYLGARVTGEPRRSSTRFAMALNARGGPGIVLATVALDAGIVNERFYVSLVLLALTTSWLAGRWLGREADGGARISAPRTSGRASRTGSSSVLPTARPPG